MSLANLKPLRDGLVVKVIPEHRSAVGGLIVPVDAGATTCVHDTWGTSLKVRWAEVISTGPGHRDKKGNLKPLDVKPGDLVSFAGLTRMEEPPYVLIVEADILCVENAEENVRTNAA